MGDTKSFVTRWELSLVVVAFFCIIGLMLASLSRGNVTLALYKGLLDCRASYRLADDSQTPNLSCSLELTNSAHLLSSSTIKDAAWAALMDTHYSNKTVLDQTGNTTLDIESIQITNRSSRFKLLRFWSDDWRVELQTPQERCLLTTNQLDCRLNV